MSSQTTQKQTDEPGALHDHTVTTLEEQLRCDLLVGGWETGRERAYTALEQAGRAAKFQDGLSSFFGNAREISSTITWETRYVTDDPASVTYTPPEDTHAQQLTAGEETDHVLAEPLALDRLRSNTKNAVDFEAFGLEFPMYLVTVQSEPTSTRYPFLPLYGANLAIGSCGAKIYQRERFPLCKHEIATLIAIGNNSFEINGPEPAAPLAHPINSAVLSQTASEPADYVPSSTKF